MPRWTGSKDKLDKEINDELYHSSDVYETKEIEGQQFFRFQVSFPSVHQYDRTTQPYPLDIPCDKIKIETRVPPLDGKGNEQSRITCRFDGQGSCEIKLNDSYYKPVQHKLKVLSVKGDKKPTSIHG